jgi:hypothetical protein
MGFKDSIPINFGSNNQRFDIRGKKVLKEAI